MIKKIEQETKIMDTLDNCVYEFLKLNGTNDKDNKEFIEHIRECQKVLALVSFRNIENIED